MGSIIRKIKMVAVVLAAVMAIPAISFAAQGRGPDECVAKYESWEVVTNDGKMSLLTALRYANSEYLPGQYCQKRVSIDVPNNRLYMKSPLEIRGGGNGFVLQGANDTATVLDAGGLKEHDSSDRCAVKITGNAVTLSNLEIINVPSGWTAVCADYNNASVRDVKIISAGNGIVFQDGITGGEIGGLLKDELGLGEEDAGEFAATHVELVGNDESFFAVNLGNSTGSLSTNRIVPMEIEEGVKTDDFGTILPAEGTPRVILKAKVKQLITGNSDVYVCLKEAKEVTVGAQKGMVRVEGFVKNQGAIDQDIVRLQIYDKNGFRGYVGDYNKDKRVGMGRTTLVGSQASGKTGSFKFFIDKDTDSSEIVLVPEDVSHNVGKPSLPIKLVGTTSGDCRDESIGSDLGDGGESEDGVATSGKRRVLSQLHCEALRGIGDAGETGNELGIEYDTDGDGIPDDLEDVNFNCSCDSDIGETCWYLADTDFDGVPDGVGNEKGCLEWELNEYGIPVMCAKFDDPDGDGLSNALDSDSDGDGRPDGMEDRNGAVTFDAGGQALKGLLYLRESGNLNPVTDKENKPIECSLGVGRDTGVSYSWYEVTYDGQMIVSANEIGSFVPEGVEGEEENVTRRENRVMTCRLQSLAWPQNFNGVYDQSNYETNPYSDIEMPDGSIVKAIDTDGDGFCDGAGAKCEGMKKDGCPAVPGKGTVDGCGKELPCLPMLPMFTTHPDWVEKDDKAMPIGLKMNPATNVPELFELKDENGRPDYEKIATLCSGDFDKDGIPDCIESPFINQNCQDTRTGLYFNRADSDGDGLIDGKGPGVGMGESTGWDVCPGSDKKDDKFVESKSVNDYSCDPYTYYQDHKILSCFLDRDGDGLRDCEEDVDMNAQYNRNQKVSVPGVDGQVMLTFEVMLGIETDILSGDSDDDGIGDYQERFQPVKSLVDGTAIFTNPANPDTDGDSFKDGEEDRNNDGVFTIAVKDSGSNGCQQLLNLASFDTDPTMADSDGDGVDDYLELSGEQLVVGQAFLNMLANIDLLNGSIATISHPMIVDSDGDGLPDGLEYRGGEVRHYDSNPCMADSDMDDREDRNEFVGCALNKDPMCNGTGTKMEDKEVGGMVDTSDGKDSDSDDLSDICEMTLGTDPQNRDSDGDGLLDGEETNGECVYVRGKVFPDGRYMTNPLAADTDGDGLNDFLEYLYGADPTNVDSDGDCIPDGVEDANANGRWDAGESNALSADTDGDGLPDGLIRGIGEDMNCNGMRDQDANGAWLETDPTNPDSDFDGITDFDEMMQGGWNPMANVARATSGANEGCSMTGSAGAPSGMIYLLGMLLMATKIAASRMRRREEE